jgi:hypothetical protein
MLEHEKYFDAEKLVNEALNVEPGFSLPDNFADMVAEKVSRKFAWIQYLKEFFVYLSVIIAMGLGIAGTSIFWFDANWKTWLDFIGSNVGIVAGIGILITFVLFADRVLLRYFMFKSNMETV